MISADKILDCPLVGSEVFVPSEESEGLREFAGVGKLGPSLP